MDNTPTTNKGGFRFMPLIIGALVLLVLAGGFMYFQSANTNNTNPENMTVEEGTQTAPQESEPSTDTTTETTAGEEQLFEVEGGAFYFKPNEIRVKQGDTVKIVFTNAGGTHNFVLDEFNVTMNPIQTGQTETVEFVADKKGTFEYYCSVGNHRQMGQIGKLIVE